MPRWQIFQNNISEQHRYVEHFRPQFQSTAVSLKYKTNCTHVQIVLIAFICIILQNNDAGKTSALTHSASTSFPIQYLQSNQLLKQFNFILIFRMFLKIPLCEKGLKAKREADRDITLLSQLTLNERSLCFKSNSLPLFLIFKTNFAMSLT